MTMTAAELHALAPFGARIRYSDGTPQPPARFTNKLRDWRRRNGEGLFHEVKAAGNYPATFTLRTGVYMSADSVPVIITNLTFDTTSALTFEIVEPAPAAVVVEDKSSIAAGWLSIVERAPTGDANAAQAWIAALSRTPTFPYAVRTQ